jgi:hypothetical protein
MSVRTAKSLNTSVNVKLTSARTFRRPRGGPVESAAGRLAALSDVSRSVVAVAKSQISSAGEARPGW